jgi:hypothetical protein
MEREAEDAAEREVTPRFPEIRAEIYGTGASYWADIKAVRQALHAAGHAADVPAFVYRALDAAPGGDCVKVCEEWVTVTKIT